MAGENDRPLPRVYEFSESFDWLINHHRANLVQNVSSLHPMSYWSRRTIGKDQNRRLGGRTGFRVDFAELQRMRMRKLQIKLLRHVAAMVKNGKEPSKPNSRARDKAEGGDDPENEENGEKWTSWDKDLEDYIKAVRDYDYMVGFSGLHDSPFIASSERRVDHKILEEEMNEAGISFSFLVEQIHRPGAKIVPTGPWSPKDEPIWAKRYLGNVKSVWRRILTRFRALMAAYFFVLLPITAITLFTLLPDVGSGLLAKLAPFITLIVFVAFWGLAMIFTAPSVKDVIPLTAGYAAVLGIVLNGVASLRQALFPGANA